MEPLTEAQREAVRQEILKHRKAAYDEGRAIGRGEGEAITVGNWVRGILKSWTMWVGAGGVVAGLSAEVWPVAAEVLKDYIDPRTLAIASAIFMALRVKTKEALPAK